jgi:protein tyrosine/serine phosphatase
MPRRLLLAVAALLLFLPAAQARPPEWAQPVALAGVPNLHKVSDSLYRSAQPTAEGMRNLEKLGVRKVINLRAFHSDRDEIAGTGLLDEELSVKTWHIEDEDVVRVLRIVKNPAGGPYLIHCLHGADRTGTMVAMVRMVLQGWPREKAIDELVNGGYGFHPIWTNILSYLKAVDLARIRAEVNR